MAGPRVEVVLASAKALCARTARVELALAVGAEHARKLPSGPKRPLCPEPERDERRKKMTCGARVSVTDEMKYMSSYTPAAGPRLCSYVFIAIFVENEEL